MANELTGQISVNYSKNGSTFSCGPFNFQVAVTGNDAIKNTRSIATSDVSLPLGSVSTIGYVWLKNLDATNFITFGPDGTNYYLKLKPGEAGFFRWNAAALHAKADTAACLLEYAIFED